MDNISFITKVSTATGTDIETTQKLIQAMSRAISEKLSQGDNVVVPGLGEFSAVVVPQHVQEDELTMRAMCMPQSQQVSFSPSATLKKLL